MTSPAVPGTAQVQAGRHARAPKPRGMLRPLLGTWERNLERTLLRKGVGRLREGAARCADCGRAPLIGELVHRFGREELVCDLCRPRRRTRPVRAERIQHAEHGLTVRAVARAA